MMAERDATVSHTTIMRWVLRFAPEYECRWARFSRPPGESWRMDETAVSVRGGRHYLFRAVDKNGKSIGSLLCNDRNKESAQAFFVQLSPMDESHGLRKSTSMAIKQPSEVWSRLVRKIPVGGKWKCVRGGISTTWLSKTIGPLNSGARRC